MKSGMWGASLDLPCRYPPGPLANDPVEFYQHIWRTILNGQRSPISFPSVNYRDNDTDFSLTIVQLNPFLARFNYQCGIDFLVKGVPSQPYNLRDSPTSPANAIEIVITETDGKSINHLKFSLN